MAACCPSHVQYGIDNINEEVRQWLLGEAPLPQEILGGTGPLWTRALSDLELEPVGERVENYCELVQEVLAALDEDPRRGVVVLRTTGSPDPWGFIVSRIEDFSRAPTSTLLERQRLAVLGQLQAEVRTPLGLARRLATAAPNGAEQAGLGQRLGLSALTDANAMAGQAQRAKRRFSASSGLQLKGPPKQPKRGRPRRNKPNGGPVRGKPVGKPMGKPVGKSIDKRVGKPASQGSQP